MIREVTMYRAVCDRCRKEGWAFSTPALAVQHAKSRLQWQEINGKLYCPDCVEYDSINPKKERLIMEEKKVKVSRENWDYLVDKLQYILADHLHGGESDEVIAEFENLLEIDNPEEKKLNLKPFDLEKAKAGKPVCTRDGRKARIICFDRVGDFPIVALTDDRDYKEEGVNLYDINGKGSNECFDLMMLPEKKEGWVNIYRNYAEIETGIEVYNTEKDAKKGIANNSNSSLYLDTIKISWEE